MQNHTIPSLMSERDRLDAKLAAMPPSVGSTDDAWESVFDRKCDVEDAIMTREATTIEDLRRQIAMLARRAVDGLDVATELVRLWERQRDA